MGKWETYTLYSVRETYFAMSVFLGKCMPYIVSEGPVCTAVLILVANSTKVIRHFVLEFRIF